MTILTSKAKTARKDYLGDNSKMFIPFNEGIGDTVKELVSGVDLTTEGSTHSVAHAITTSIAVTQEQEKFKELSGGDNIIFGFIVTPNTSAGFAIIALGSPSTGFFVKCDGTGVMVGSDEGGDVNAPVSGVTLGQSAIVVGTYNGTSGELRSYVGVNGGSVAFGSTTDASIHIPEKLFKKQIQIDFSYSFKQDHYLYFCETPNALPSEADLLAALDWTYTKSLQGHKVLHPTISGV